MPSSSRSATAWSIACELRQPITRIRRKHAPLNDRPPCPASQTAPPVTQPLIDHQRRLVQTTTDLLTDAVSRPNVSSPLHAAAPQHEPVQPTPEIDTDPAREAFRIPSRLGDRWTEFRFAQA